MKALVLKALNHLKYPSSWHGINAVLVAVGVSLRPELMDQIIAAGAAVSGLLAFALSDVDVKK